MVVISLIKWDLKSLKVFLHTFSNDTLNSKLFIQWFAQQNISKTTAKGHYYTYQIIKPTTDHWLKKFPLWITELKRETIPFFIHLKSQWKKFLAFTQRMELSMATPLIIWILQQWPPLNHCCFSISIQQFLLYCAKQSFVLQLLCSPGRKKELLKTAVLRPFYKRTSIDCICG